MKGQEDSPDSSRLEELWTRWIGDRSLLPREEEELAQAAATNAAFRELILADERLEGALAALGRQAADGEAFARQFAKRVGAERDGASFVSSVQRRMRAEVVAGALARERPRRLLPWLLIPAAAVGMVAAALVLIWWRADASPPRQVLERPPAALPHAPVRSVRLNPAVTAPAAERAAQLSESTGLVYVLTEGRRLPASAGLALPAGAGLVTVGGTSRAAIAFPDRMRLTLEADTVLAQLGEATAAGEPARAGFVARGRVQAEVPPEARALVLTTPQAEVVSSGGKLLLSVDGVRTRLDVNEGRAEIGRAGAGVPTTVAAAQFAVVAEPDEVPTARTRGGIALLVGDGALVLSVSDDRVKKRLESLGFEVHTQRAGPPRPEELRSARLIVISSTASARAMGAYYRDLATPIIVWEPYSFDDLGMTGAVSKVDQGWEDSLGQAQIEDPGHPLAAGHSGTVILIENPGGLRLRLRRMSYGAPGPHAQVVAVWPGNPSRALVFAYERGSPMPGLPAAPGRRVGLFMHDFTAKVMTDAAWSLFDAAVAWCVRGDAGPRP